MATPVQIAANRRNALRSTGPRTAAGKAASSRNALRHGLAARTAVVPGEDPADFERFRAELREALAPRNGLEEVLAEVAVEAAWRLRRAWRAEAALFNRRGRSKLVPPCLRELLILRYEIAANRRFHCAVAMLERGRRLERRKRATARSRSPHCRHARACRGHPRVLGPEMRGTSPRMTSPMGERREEAQPDWRNRTATCASRASRSRSTAAATAQDHRFRATNPISRPRADSQSLGVVGVWSSRCSRSAFAENRLISWKSARKRPQTGENPFESALACPSWGQATRAAASPSAYRAPMIPD